MSALIPDSPTPLGTLNAMGGVASPFAPPSGPVPFSDIANQNAMADEAIGNLNQRAVPAPSVPFTKVETKIDPETREQTTSIHGITQQFLGEITNLVNLGRQTQNAYQGAIDRVAARRQTLEEHPVLAEFGRIASLAALNYQGMGLRGAAAAPLTHAAGQYGSSIFGETPEDLAIKEAQLRTQELGAATAVSNTLERGADLETRQNEIATQNAIRNQAQIDADTRNYMETARAGAVNKDVAESMHDTLIAHGASEQYASAFVKAAQGVSDNARSNKEISPIDLEIRAGGAQVPGGPDVPANKLTQQAAIAAIRSRQLGQRPEKPDYNQFAIYAQMLGAPSSDPGVLGKTPEGQKWIEKIQTYAEAGITPTEASNVVTALTNTLPNGQKLPPTIQADNIRSVLTTFGKGGGKARLLLYDLAKQRDPNFSLTEQDRKVDMLNDFEVSNQPRSANSQRISLGTLMQHIDEAGKAYDQVASTRSPALNSAIRTFQDQTGQPQLNAFRAAILAVRQEYSTALKSGYAPFLLDEKDAAKIFDENKSPEAIMAALKQAGITINDRWTERDATFKRLFGTSFPEPFSAKAQAGAARLGIQLGPQPEAAPAAIPQGAIVIHE